jgi:Mrp family chromosome partitioning ATPase
MLRTAILLQPVSGPQSASAAASDHGLRDVILVVSAGAEPTRALVVTNLAAAFAEAGQQALVITTADLRQLDRQADTMVMASSVDLDMSPATVAGATRATEIPGVRSLALGRLLDGPGQLARYAPAIVASARQDADVVIVDAPLLAVHDAEALVPAVDVVVVVVQSWWTRVDQATQSGAFLRRIAAPVVGAALTEVHFGHKDLRSVLDRAARTDAQDEDEMVGASSMTRHGRWRGRRSRWVEA